MDPLGTPIVIRKKTQLCPFVFMPQSHPTTGPVRFLPPVRFLARKAEWSARRNSTSVLFLWSHQATGPVRLDTAVYLWFGWIIRMTPRVPRAGIVRAPYGNLQCFSYPTGPVRGPCGPTRVPYGALMDTQGNWHNQNWQKTLTGVVFCRTRPVRFPHGMFTGCLKSLNPYGARKLIMHALKLYGPVREGKIRTAPHGARAGPVSGRTIFVQNSPGTARTGPGSVMWLRHYVWNSVPCLL